MPKQTNYEKGRAHEYARMAFYRRCGCTVMRTAGSHGLADLIVLGQNGGVTLVQCKVVQSEARARKMCENFEADGGFTKAGRFVQVLEVKVPKIGLFAGIVYDADPPVKVGITELDWNLPND